MKAMRFSSLASPIVVSLALAVSGCDEGNNTPDVVFGSPIDFSVACEGAGATFKPVMTDDADDQGLCDDPADDSVRAHLLGLVLNRSPAEVHILQLNDDRRVGNESLGTGIVDADRFKPGFNGIPVASAPLRLLRSPQWDSFYVVSAGESRVERLVIEGIGVDTGVRYNKTSWSLPGVPAKAILINDQLIVAAAQEPTLWRYDLNTDPSNPTRTDIALPSVVDGLHGFGSELILTWSDRPVMSTMALGDLTRVDEVPVWFDTGLAPACSDTLDLDTQTPNCDDSQDTSELGTRVAWPDPDLTSVGGFPSSISACEDGIDNDRDGLIDGYDPACADGGDGELLTACADGIDNDGDGLTDLEDRSCYGPSDLTEVTESAFGPFSVTTVDAGDAGQFAYVLDRSRDHVLVYERAEGRWVEIDAAGFSATVPELSYSSVETGEINTIDAIAHTALPGPSWNGERGIFLEGAQGLSLSSSRLRGEVWTRVIASGDVNLETSSWTPTGCAVDSPDGSCLQPEEDDTSWFVFMPTMDGKVLMIESVRRGVPLHRLAQSARAPETRDHAVGTPLLTFRDTLTSAATSLPEGFALLGPNTEEEVEAVVTGESPARYRAFGVWPPAQTAQTANEVWSVSYEGALPNTAGAGGRFVDETTFYAPAIRFCDAGVNGAMNGDVEDLISVDVHREQVPSDLRIELGLETPEGVACPVEASEHLTIDFPILEVGDTSVRVDTSRARIRPHPPELGEIEVNETQLNLANECQEAFDRMDLAAYELETEVTPAMLPRAMTFVVRTQDSWLIEGSRTGFVHANKWNPETGTCDAGGEEMTIPVGRITEREPSAVEAYSSCPPLNSDLSVDSPLVDNEPGFENWSFGLDLFPGCWLESDGSITHAPSRRGTTWTFSVVGPSQPKTLSSRSLESASGSLLHAQPLIPLETFRWQALLDTAGRRVTLTTLNASAQSTLATFD